MEKTVKKGDEFNFSMGQASNLREFLDHLTALDQKEFQKYIENGDFPRWVKESLKLDFLSKKIENKKTRSSLVKEIESYLDDNIPQKISSTIQNKKRKLKLHPFLELILWIGLGFLSGLILSSL